MMQDEGPYKIQCWLFLYVTYNSYLCILGWFLIVFFIEFPSSRPLILVSGCVSQHSDICNFYFTLGLMCRVHCSVILTLCLFYSFIFIFHVDL